jgi:hypothetical protein
MVQKWKVSWNKSLYNYKEVIRLFNEQGIDEIKQSKGRATMINMPTIGDIVYISCNKLRIIKCVVISDFITDLKEKTDIHNEGIVRYHTDNNTYLKLRIIKTYGDPTYLRGCQRTWCRYSP